MELLILTISIISLILSAIVLVSVFSVSKKNGSSSDFDKLKSQIFDEMRQSRIENSKSTQENIKLVSNILSDTQKANAKMLDDRLKEISERFKLFSLENEQKLENIRITVENRLKSVSENNEKQLEKIRFSDQKRPMSLPALSRITAGKLWRTIPQFPREPAQQKSLSAPTSFRPTLYAVSE